MKQPIIVKTLDCSTAHVTQKDMELLQNEESGVIAYPYKEGAFVFVGESSIEKEPLLQTGFSAAFISLVQKANKLGCKYLQLDSDADTYDDIPTFEW